MNKIIAWFTALKEKKALKQAYEDSLYQYIKDLRRMTMAGIIKQGDKTDIQYRNNISSIIEELATL